MENLETNEKFSETRITLLFSCWWIQNIQLFQLRLSDLTQAHATRPKGSVGSCKSVLVNGCQKLVGNFEFLSTSNKLAPSDYCQRQS